MTEADIKKYREQSEAKKKQRAAQEKTNRELEARELEEQKANLSGVASRGEEVTRYAFEVLGDLGVDLGQQEDKVPQQNDDLGTFPMRTWLPLEPLEPNDEEVCIEFSITHDQKQQTCLLKVAVRGVNLPGLPFSKSISEVELRKEKQMEWVKKNLDEALGLYCRNSIAQP